MWRRWIIRGPFLGLVVLCVGGWGWSYAEHPPLVGIAHIENPNCQFMAMVDRGTLYVIRSQYCMLFPEGVFCQWDAPRLSARRRSQFLGFSNESDGFFHSTGVPMWLLTALFGLVFFGMWRKTRWRPMGEGFPVEITPRAETANGAGGAHGPA